MTVATVAVMVIAAPATPTPTRERATGVLEAIYQRRAVRAYTGEVVGADAVRLLLRAAVHAPTAMHREPWAFVIVQDPLLLAELNRRIKRELANGPLRELVRAPVAGRVPSDLLADDNFCVFHGAGTLIVICAPVLPLVEADCWLAAENLMLAAVSLGLGTCPIGVSLAALASPDVKAQLGIPPEMSPIAPIVVGVPRERPPYVPRRDPHILAWR